MIKEITIAGITLDNYSVKESIIMIEKCLSANFFTTIEEVGMKTLFLATEDNVVKETLEKMDMTIIVETEMLQAMEQLTMQRKHEIEEQEFFFQLMKKMDRGRKSVFLLGETEQEIEKASEFILEEFPHICMVGSRALENCSGAEEGIINDINAITPDMVISVLPSPIQEHFLAAHKGMLSTNLWYGVGSGKFETSKHSFARKVMKWIRSKRLMEYIKGYEKQEERENEK
ncbi:MAG: WecB/TagA/CpsF family glycosyltransferase [Lachnospiraceae bacterium]|nr:WecB/TagA/CpsF family glycosyltransferase [Lachnospiraceae bacterium]